MSIIPSCQERGNFTQTNWNQVLIPHMCELVPKRNQNELCTGTPNPLGKQFHLKAAPLAPIVQSQYLKKFSFLAVNQSALWGDTHTHTHKSFRLCFLETLLGCVSFFQKIQKAAQEKVTIKREVTSVYMGTDLPLHKQWMFEPFTLNLCT